MSLNKLLFYRDVYRDVTLVGSENSVIMLHLFGVSNYLQCSKALANAKECHKRMYRFTCLNVWRLCLCLYENISRVLAFYFQTLIVLNKMFIKDSILAEMFISVYQEIYIFFLFAKWWTPHLFWIPIGEGVQNTMAAKYWPLPIFDNITHPLSNCRMICCLL